MRALPRSLAPAGSALTMSARDLLTFARSQLPDNGDAWSLGWEIFHVGGHTIYGHNGDTIGQSAYLRLLPADDMARIWRRAEV